MAAPAAGDNRDLRARGADAITATPSPNALSNALSALEFHSIEVIFIFCTERAHDPRLRQGEISVMNQ
jgi:hypothetical protein